MRVLVVWLGAALCGAAGVMLGAMLLDIARTQQMPEPRQLPGLFFFFMITLVFCLAGSALLFAVHAVMRRAGARPAMADLALPLVAVALGAAMLWSLGLGAGFGATVGGLFAALTALAWVALARLVGYGRNVANQTR